MHRYWFAVQCGPYIGAFQAVDARAAAYMAILHWTVEDEDRCSQNHCEVTAVVPAGGHALQDYQFFQTKELLRALHTPRNNAALPQPCQCSASPKFAHVDVSVRVD